MFLAENVCSCSSSCKLHLFAAEVEDRHGNYIKHSTDVVDKGLVVLFFGLFCYFSVFFPFLPLHLENFLPDALEYIASFNFLVEQFRSII